MGLAMIKLILAFEIVKEQNRTGMLPPWTWRADELANHIFEAIMLLDSTTPTADVFHIINATAANLGVRL